MQKIGLNDGQAKAYSVLVQKGGMSPPELAEQISESRTNTYNILDQLLAMGLVERQESPRLTYIAKNPSALKQLLIDRTREMNKVSTELTSLLPELQAMYRLAYDQPGIVQMQGLDVFRNIYDDVIASKSELLILPSQFDRDDPEVAKVIDEQITKQNEAGIQTKVAAARELSPKKSVVELSGTEIHYSLSDRLPAQIMVYGDNVAFTTFRNGVLSTVLTNPEIAETMRRLFMQLYADVQN